MIVQCFFLVIAHGRPPERKSPTFIFPVKCISFGQVLFQGTYLFTTESAMDLDLLPSLVELWSFWPLSTPLNYFVTFLTNVAIKVIIFLFFDSVSEFKLLKFFLPRIFPILLLLCSRLNLLPFLRHTFQLRDFLGEIGIIIHTFLEMGRDRLLDLKQSLIRNLPAQLSLRHLNHPLDLGLTQPHQIVIPL